jgi:hypothetical protein
VFDELTFKSTWASHKSSFYCKSGRTRVLRLVDLKHEVIWPKWKVSYFDNLIWMLVDVKMKRSYLVHHINEMIWYSHLVHHISMVWFTLITWPRSLTLFHNWIYALSFGHAPKRFHWRVHPLSLTCLGGQGHLTALNQERRNLPTFPNVEVKMCVLEQLFCF